MAKKLSPTALYDLRFVSEPQLSPDARTTVAVVTRIDQAGDDEPPRYLSCLWRFSLDGSKRPLTNDTSSATSPRFSPDGKYLAFLAKREGDDAKQLYVLPTDGGEARRLTAFKAGVNEFVWHPDSARLALATRGDWEDEATKRGRGRTIERLAYKRDGNGFLPDAPAQLHVLEHESGHTSQLGKLEADPTGLVFSPDGKTLYFSAPKDQDEQDAWRSELWALELRRKRPRRLKTGVPACALPAPSPDGKRLAFFAFSDHDGKASNFASPFGLWVVESRGGKARLVSGELEVTPSLGGDSRYGSYPTRAQWAADGKRIHVILNEEGRSHLASIDVESGKVRRLQGGDRAVTGFTMAHGTFAFTAETPERPGELFVLANGEERQLSAVNQAFVERYALASASEERRLEVAPGVVVPYWTLEPARPRKDRAMVLQIHGGPRTNYGYGFYFEFQLLAARGYTVVYGNPRGSSSYGHAFSTAILGRYGTLDADDVLAIARDARARHHRADAPMHLTGGSYGGFMTNWLVAHTDEFRSAVSQRSICNWLSFYGASDIGYRFTPVQQGGNPWDDTEKLWEQSPLKYVANVTTPTLVLHAEADHRCPVEQAEQWFVALKQLGKAPTRLIRFPDEGHELSRSGRPDRRVQRLEAIVGWFEEHT
jgi:acylaminoacyl-peptidase